MSDQNDSADEALGLSEAAPHYHGHRERLRGLRRDNQDGNPATIRMRMRRCWGDEGRA